MSQFRTAAGSLSLIALAACSGGGGGGGGGSGWTPGVFLPESHFAAQCASPRSGTDPYTGQPYPDVAGSTLDENNWLRSWTNDVYLWYSEVQDLDPANYASTATYFPLLKTTANDSQGQPKDKFHFTYQTSVWEALARSGTNVGYGAQFIALQRTPPRKILIAFTEPGSPAATAPASLARGAEVLTVDGADVVNGATQADVDAINAGLSPSTLGESHSFSFLDQGATAARAVTLTAANITELSVQDVKVLPNSTIGYMFFDNHLAPAEQALISAVNTLKAAGITDLILDMRYNGGGLLDIASEAAYMIAGAGPTAGQNFDLEQWNSKHPSTNPVTGGAITPVPFYNFSLGFSGSAGQPLPTLSLPRVFVLTTAGTCSASEAVMNGLAGVGVQVIQIGSTTCGKPYAFYPQDNCGTTYFSIETQGVNAKGFGDYPDGFTPAGSGAASFPGCVVSDDFTHQLGDPNESLLFVAQAKAMGSAACVTPPAGVAPPGQPAQQGVLIRSPLREMRLLRPTSGR